MSADVRNAMRFAWMDIATAPKGSGHEVETGKGTRLVFDKEWIWSCRVRDDHVTKTYWDRDRNAWIGFTAEDGPDLWQPVIVPPSPTAV